MFLLDTLYSPSLVWSTYLILSHVISYVIVLSFLSFSFVFILVMYMTSSFVNSTISVPSYRLILFSFSPTPYSSSFPAGVLPMTGLSLPLTMAARMSTIRSAAAMDVTSATLS